MMDSLEMMIVVASTVAGCMGLLLSSRASRQERRLRSQLEALLTASTDAILWLDRRGFVRSCNESCSRIFGRSASEMRGVPIDSLIPSLTLDQPQNHFRCPRNGQSHWKLIELGDGTALYADGARFPVAVTIERLGEDNNDSSVVIVRDSSKQSIAQRELERYAHQLLLAKQCLEQQNQRLERTVQARTEELRLEKDKAELANKAKSDFLANMSHELRTPLHAILSFSRFGLERGDACDRDKLIQYFKNIQSSGNTLLHLVNQLLDIAKLESGTVVLDRQPTQLRTLVGTVCTELNAIAVERGITLSLELAEEVPQLYLDRNRISQVIRNLIGNALKVSPSDSRVTVVLTSDTERATVQVIDQGPGIPEEELESIFKQFVQSTRTNTGAGGTGLGLAISQEIISLHGGRIWAENVFPNGAMVSFELPMLIEDEQNSSGHREQPESASSSNGHTSTEDLVQSRNNYVYS